MKTPNKKTKRIKKLLLFDIDGTLVTTRGLGVSYWKQSIELAFAHAFAPLPAFDERLLNGKLERQYFRELSLLIGVSQEEFEQKFPKANELFTQRFIEAIDTKQFEILRIHTAYEAVQKLRASESVSLGLLTGNNEKLAWHKMKAAQFEEPFSFGVFGTERDKRGELVHLAKERAEEKYQTSYTMADIVVIGDTKHDIEAAKYAGAIALGVTTGLTDSRSDLEKAGADLVVDSLLDHAAVSLMSS